MRGGPAPRRRGAAIWRAGWLAALLALMSSVEAPARSFRVADTQPEDYPTVQALFYLDRLVQERTGGRHRLQIFHSRQLGEEKETIEQTKVGAIDLNRTNVAPLADYVPEAKVLVMPFLFRSVEHLHRVLDGPIGADILKHFEGSGFVGLAFYDSGARSIYNSLRPIRSLSDLKGLRIRIQQSELMTEVFRTLGAEPVPLPYGQVMTGLSTKLIDGAENNWPSYVTAGHYRVAPYYSVTAHTMSPEVLIMSEKAWAGLTPEDQAVFREAAQESARYMREQWRLWEQRAQREAQLGGVIVNAELDTKPFAAALSEVYDRLLTDPKLKSLVDRIRQTP